MANQTVRVPNPCHPETDLLTGGQPTAEALEEASKAGYRTVVNLRGPGEAIDYDEESVVRGLGMNYVCIPITGPHDLHDEAAHRLDEVLSDTTARPALIHCGSGNRVGALLALHACVKGGASPDESLDYGRKAGLTSPELDRFLRGELEKKRGNGG